MDNIGAVAQVLTLFMFVGMGIFVLRSLSVIHSNVNSNLQESRAENVGMRQENIRLHKEIRELLAAAIEKAEEKGDT